MISWKLLKSFLLYDNKVSLPMSSIVATTVASWIYCPLISYFSIRGINRDITSIVMPATLNTEEKYRI